MQTSIVILTYNKVDYTKLCVESIRKFTPKGTYEIIVVDNNSTDETIKWLKQQKDIRTVLNKENLGFPKGCNQGIEIASGGDILLLNNDTVVTHNWLSNLRLCLYSSKDIGAVGAVTNNCSYYQAIPTKYKNLEGMHQFAKKHNVSNPDLWDDRLKLVGFCMLIKREVVDQVGLLDELFTPGNYEDDDYSLRIRKAGYRLILCKDTFIHHFGSVSFKDNIEKFKGLLELNRAKFTKKWGFDPNYSSFIRHEIVDLIDRPKNDGIKVLEIGCSSGGTLLQIKNVYRNADLYGIELNEQAVKDAARFAEIQIKNVEESELDYPEAFFDYVILADILEHLNSPWTLLKKLIRHAKPEGKIIASIPNVMHYSVIRNLINGNWTYEDAGILDRTHLRFFTLHEIEKMFTEAGCTDMKYSATRLPLTEVDKDFIEKISKAASKEMAEQYTVYQYIVTAGTRNSRTILRDTLRSILQNEEIERNIQKLSDFNVNEVINAICDDIGLDAGLLNLLAIKNFESGEYDRVLPYLNKAREIVPSDTDTLYNLGYVLYSLDEKQLALTYLKQIEVPDEEVTNLIQAILGHHKNLK